MFLPVLRLHMQALCVALHAEGGANFCKEADVCLEDKRKG